MRYASLYQPENVWVVRFINKLVCRAYCDRVVKLSDSLQELPRSTSCNVRQHGQKRPPTARHALALAHGGSFGSRAESLGRRAVARLPGSVSEAPPKAPRLAVQVHGVRAEFLSLGRQAGDPQHEFSKGAYFIGKLLWAKGHGLLIDYLAGEEDVRVDLYGDGEDSAKVQAKVWPRLV